MIATREHLMMVLADLDDILIRASYSTEMRSSSISDISMEVAVPNYSGLAQALEVEQCRCPPGYQGLSCQVNIFLKIHSSDFSFFFLFTWLCLNQVCVIFRTVLLAIPAPVVACTWVTVSSVNAMVTLTPVTRRPASVQYEAPDQLMIGIFLWIKASWQDL